jgi:hypothetical protein
MPHRAGFDPDVVNRVLDHVQRRCLLEQPARKHPSPFLVAAKDNHLDECAGQLVLFPGLGLVAGAQFDDDIVDADALPRFEVKIARQAIAFVQYAQCCNALRHRRCRFDLHNPLWRCFFGNDRLHARVGDRILDCRCRRRNGEQTQTAADKPAPVHAPSGVHAS